MLDRFLTAVESIAASLKAIAEKASSTDKAPSTDTAAPAKETKPKATKPETVKADPPKAEVVKQAPAFAYDTLKTNVVKLANMGAPGKNAALGILAEYNVTKADKIPEDQWPAANDKFLQAAVELADPPKGEDDFA